MDNWDELDVWSQAKMLAYHQTRDYDETPNQPKTSPIHNQPKGRRR